MRILITGAKGMLGQDLASVLDQNGFDLILADKEEMDITDFEQVQTFINNNEPDFVIHCAAYTNVDLAESEKEKAFLVNETGSENVAKACAQIDIPILFISTDYVFDGKSNRPYTPQDEPNPINVYGASKLAGEKAVQKSNPSNYIVRTSWLYGLHGKNFVETMISLSEKMPRLSVVDDQKGCPTWSVALSYGILRLIREKAPFGIYHICGSGSASWYEFAKEIFKLSSIEKIILPVKSKDFNRPANRPEFSVMDNKNMLPDWKDSLKNYLQLRSL